MRDFLVELQTEELPPKRLKELGAHFLKEIETRLTKAELSYHSGHYFVTPRRLAVIIKRLASQQPDSLLERKGPALQAAFDPQGNPTPACLGFARSCGILPEQLEKMKTPQGEWVGYQQTVKGKPAQALLAAIIPQAINALPIPKRMRWGDNAVEFVRPVHSIILLYGNEIIPAHIFHLQTDRKTRGHRFHSKGWFNIASPGRYLKSLEKKYVLADFEQRKEKIRALTFAAVKHMAEKTQENLFPLIDETVLDEVTGLVEWPVALCGQFDKDFLMVPQEALISAMQDHQRYFPVVNAEGKLQPYFVTISNIESQSPAQVIAGNERVLRARLSDAKFFFELDMAETFEARLERLKGMVFQQKLGTLFDKAKRLEKLTHDILFFMNDNAGLANQTSVLKADFMTQNAGLADQTDLSEKSNLTTQNADLVSQANGSEKVDLTQNANLTNLTGLLAKTDLTTQLVGEFPELQGTMGYYCAFQLPNDPHHFVATALLEQYFPRFSGDKLPESSLGCALALADRLDTLIGIFGIHQIPTGDKDPFALRRAALGILRILIEKKLPLDLRQLLQLALDQYKIQLENLTVTDQVLHFILERLKPWYQEQQISADVYAAVAALNITIPYDFHCRIQAVQAFKNLPEAKALSSANKRVSNILSKYNNSFSSSKIKIELLEEAAEQQLAEQLAIQRNNVTTLLSLGKYAEILTHLAALREPIDVFFDKVLVMTDDPLRRENRLLLLKQLRELFLQVADIALLQQ